MNQTGLTHSYPERRSSDLAADAEGPDGIGEVLLQPAGKVGLETDLYHFGLRGMSDPKERGALAEKALAARAALRERLADPKLGELVELYDADRYNQNASLAEKIGRASCRERVCQYV